MLFNSIDFAIFLPVVFILYWFVTRKYLNLQNLLIVLASYVFYGWWDWRFLSLILFSTILDYSVGLALATTVRKGVRKTLLLTSVITNLGLLGFFKYYNFFIDNFIHAFSFWGYEIEAQSLNIILPVGISFYSFQTLSYTIDIYRDKLKPTKDFLAFAAFVSFFPQLVAGPIERATHLLPQFFSRRVFSPQQATDGLRQILWGLFKKVVIADHCAELANQIFNNSDQMNGSALIAGAVFFSFQIYGDFSGYSDIAIGTSRLFGFDLMRNFNYPYFSRDIAEFWRRWHISLSTWFRDYLYIPLGGSRGSTWKKIRNTFIIFIVSGFWHGANWTFIIWGVLNALYFIPLLLSNKNRNNLHGIAEGKSLPGMRDLISMTATFWLTVFAWIFFRADSVTHAISYIHRMVTQISLEIPNFRGKSDALITLMFISILLIIEWIGRDWQYGIQRLGFNWPRPIRIGFYYLMCCLIFWFAGEKQEYIYFQF